MEFLAGFFLGLLVYAFLDGWFGGRSNLFVDRVANKVATRMDELQIIPLTSIDVSVDVLIDPESRTPIKARSNLRTNHAEMAAHAVQVWADRRGLVLMPKAVATEVRRASK